MALSRTKRKGWLVTILVLAGVAILSVKYQDKLKEYAAKVPFIANLMN